MIKLPDIDQIINMPKAKFIGKKYVSGVAIEAPEYLTIEAPLQIRINGKAYTITMRTPGSDQFLIPGLLFTEKIIGSYKDILNVKESLESSGEETLVFDVKIEERVLEGKNLFNRSIASSASCGICGKIEICDLVKPDQPLHHFKTLDINIIPDLIKSMMARQSTFEKTGGSHAAAIFTVEGKLLSLHEDIGRHNAVDKAIGDLLIRDELKLAGIMLVSGRVSYEIAAKCAEVRIPFLLAVSAPSSMAVEFCIKKGITLIGFCRENRATVYTHDDKILQNKMMVIDNLRS